MQAKQLINILVFCTFSTLLSQNDTLNQIAADGFKKGYWKVFKEIDGKNTFVSEGRFLNNLKTGRWTEYFGNGNVKNHIEYKEGKVNGTAMTFHENGSVSESGTWINNRWVGEYFLYYSTSTHPQHKFYFNEKGKRDGKQYYYYENGKLAGGRDFINGKEDKSTWYSENGKVSEISIGDSTETKFSEKGNILSVTNRKNNVLNGRQIKYYTNGNLSSDLLYKSGKQHGNIILYYENGNKKFQTEYKDGRMSGERMCYEMDGKPVNGQCLTYHKDNFKEREGKCINGKPEGEFKVYDYRGNLSVVANYKDGKPDGLTYYYSYGKQTSIEKYEDGNFIEEIAVVPVESAK